MEPISTTLGILGLLTAAGIGGIQLKNSIYGSWDEKKRAELSEKALNAEQTKNALGAAMLRASDIQDRQERADDRQLQMKLGGMARQAASQQQGQQLLAAILGQGLQGSGQVMDAASQAPSNVAVRTQMANADVQRLAMLAQSNGPYSALGF